MIESKRKFFASFAAVCAAPVAGLAKAAGVTSKPTRPKPFQNGQYLTAKDLNEQFDAIHRRVDEA